MLAFIFSSTLCDHFKRECLHCRLVSMEMKTILNFQLIFRNETVTMCNNCNITLEECSIPKEPYICQKFLSDSGFKCDGCEDLFGSFKCPTVSCKQTFYKGSDLFSHTKEHHTYNPRETENHLRQEGKILELSCKVCPKQFGKLGHLKRHMTMFHGGNEDITDMSITCTICKRMFAGKSGVKKHMLLHSDTKQFSCDKCKRNFTQKANMDRHSCFHVSKASKLPKY